MQVRDGGVLVRGAAMVVGNGGANGGKWWCAKLRLLLLFADLQWRRASLLRGGSFHGCCMRKKNSRWPFAPAAFFGVCSRCVADGGQNGEADGVRCCGEGGRRGDGGGGCRGGWKGN